MYDGFHYSLVVGGGGDTLGAGGSTGGSRGGTKIPTCSNATKVLLFNPQLLSNSPGGFPMGGRGSPGGGGMPRGYGLIPPPITNGSIPWSYGQLSPRIQNPLSAGNVDTYHSHITTTFCCMALLLTIVVLASLPLLWLLGLDVSSPSFS